MKEFSIKFYVGIPKKDSEWGTLPLYSEGIANKFIVSKNEISFDWEDDSDESGHVNLSIDSENKLSGFCKYNFDHPDAILEGQFIGSTNEIQGSWRNQDKYGYLVDKFSFIVKKESLKITKPKKLNFNLDKYKIDDNYKINGNVALRCLARNKILMKLPEEVVRQKFILYLIDRYKISLNSIKAEEHLTRIKKGLKDRADIVVYNEEKKPVFIVECKAPNVPLSDETYIQALRYIKHYKTKFFMLTNGKKLIIYRKNESGSFIQIEGDPDIEQILNSKVKFAKPFVWFRSNDKLHLYPSRFEYYPNWIAVNTVRDIGIIALKIQDMLYDPTDLITNLNFGSFPLTFKKDLGVKYPSFKNPSGTVYSNFYRTFILEDDMGDFTMHIGCYAFGSVEGAKPKDYTYLYVGLSRQEKTTHTLQLMLDKFLIKDKNKNYRIEHNFRMSRKHIKEKLVSKINILAPELLQHQGVFNFEESEYFIDSKQSKDFIQRILKYGYLRNLVKSY